MPGAHSKIGPSNAHRWRPCPGSVEESEGLPNDAGEEAKQGTVFHEVADIVVDTGIPPHRFIGELFECDDEGDTRPFTKEMATKMLPGLDIIGAYEGEPGSVSQSELKVDLGPWLGEGMFGTSDYCNVNVAKRRIVVFDWKWGYVPVFPEWNDQAICYALGVWTTFAEELFEGIEPAAIEVVIIIEQPRVASAGGVWRTNMATLLAEGKVIARDAARTRVPGAPRVPGEKQCRYCPAAQYNTCKARAEWIVEALGVQAEDLLDGEPADPMILPDRRALSPEERSRILLNRGMITTFLKELYDEAMRDAELGRPVPGMKRVAGRASARKWRDSDKAAPILEARLGEQAWLKKLRSPAQIEEEVGRKAYREDWERHVLEGTPSIELVREDDKRDALPDVDDLLNNEETYI